MGIPPWKDKVLFTPGPLTTSQSVKQAQLRDFGSRDHAFIDLVRDIRRRLVAIAGTDEMLYTAVPMQGSGTFGLESVLGTATPRGGKILVAVNGAYGQRLAQMAKVLEIETVVIEFSEDTMVSAGCIAAALEGDPSIDMVCVCHCETTTGIMNPVESIGRVVRETGRLFMVDAMSSFGAVPLDVAAAGIDYLVSSANKCIEGVPGFSFAIARIETLLQTSGRARSLSLDLLAQYKGLEANGQFRFTPPTHALLAFHQALIELDEEGGVSARALRYRANHGALLAGMTSLGFEAFLAQETQGYIITSFYFPDSSNFDFKVFYDRLKDRGYVIYSGKVSNAELFRIGNIGRIDVNDFRDLLAAIAECGHEMGFLAQSAEKEAIAHVID